jgi:hypothetical protein
MLLLDKVTPIKLTPSSLITVVAVVFVLCYLVGVFYVKCNCDKIDNMVQAERNPLMKDIHTNVAKEREQL